MILTMYVLLMISTTFMLYLASTPIILGVNILMMSLLLSATFASLLSSWFAFLIFLIYIGGMLVMFAYFLALTPNQQMSSTNNTYYATVSFIILSAMVSITSMKIHMPDNFYQGNSLLYMKNSAPIIILMALVLLLTMVIVVKLTSRSKGPLRPFNYV